MGVGIMGSVKSQIDEDGSFWRRLLMSEEDRLGLFPMTTRPGGYRWFRSENVVCIERAGVLDAARGAHSSHAIRHFGKRSPLSPVCATTGLLPIRARWRDERPHFPRVY